MEGRTQRGVGRRSGQSSMYQAESLIAPKALPAKLLPWYVTLPRHPQSLRPPPRKPRFTPEYPFAPPRVSSRRQFLPLSLPFRHVFLTLHHVRDLPLSRPSYLCLATSLTRMCVHTVTYTRHLALLALRRPGKYCRHPFRDAKSDVRKPVDRPLTLFPSIEKILDVLYFLFIYIL